jgi:hypothetical protein
LENHGEDSKGAKEAFGFLVAKKEQKRQDRVISDRDVEIGGPESVMNVSPSSDPAFADAAPRAVEHVHDTLSQSPERPPSASSASAAFGNLTERGKDGEVLASASVSGKSRRAFLPRVPGPERARGSSVRSFSNRSRMALSARSPAPTAVESDVEDGQGLNLGGSSDSPRGAATAAAGLVKVRKQDERDYHDADACLEKVVSDFGADAHLDHSRQSSACVKGRAPRQELNGWGGGCP